VNTAVDTVVNPYGDAPVAARPQTDGALVTVQSAREIAEVQTSMLMARKFPRNEVEVMDRILNACTRTSLAESAFYEFARGGTDIRGPSIRLYEAVAQHWGHLDFGWRVLDEHAGKTTVQAYAWDMQTGAKSQVVFDVTHERVTRSGRTTLQDPRDIYEHVANAASRRLRACLQRVIPADVVEAAARQCEVTLRTKAEVTPERLKNLLAQFAEFGVPQASIEKRIQRRVDAMTPGMMVQLGRIFTSLRDGISQPGDWFDLGEASPAAPQGASATPAKAPQTARGAVKERLQGRQKAREAAPDPEAPPAPPAPPAPAAPASSDALMDVVNFARAAKTAPDIERAVAVAITISDEAEQRLAQEHIDAARRRIAS
jgi:hypothetical protein